MNEKYLLSSTKTALKKSMTCLKYQILESERNNELENANNFSLKLSFKKNKSSAKDFTF